ncbi:hypothetical protein HSX44_03245 [Wolbachia endosymbiont of Onchocerca gibsoni]|uniref:hypothetical protein n=1 Tax=Wolbachia endosymbiont of Onchocerca gibsoni TaxID=118986 RepID=UPI0023D8141A|nr:hypothetical protein [Wolbachia endosymbiont of Onchocerca gibsoni]MDF0607882.1 hypothetical protein [Wolbachia endosymbiont of Onchocerca gibsoni]
MQTINIFMPKQDGFENDNQLSSCYTLVAKELREKSIDSPHIYAAQVNPTAKQEIKNKMTNIFMKE